MLFDRLFRKTDAPAGRVADWTTVVQLVGYFGGSAVLSWVASTVDPIMQYGWGAAIIAGIVLACGLSLAGSGFLFALAAYHRSKLPPAVKDELGDAHRSQLALNIADLDRRVKKTMDVIASKFEEEDERSVQFHSTIEDIAIRLSGLEEALAPTPPGLMGAIFNRYGLAKDSRLTEIETSIKAISDSVSEASGTFVARTKALEGKLSADIDQALFRCQLLTTSLRARDAREIIRQNDKVVLDSGKKLLRSDDTLDDQSWAAEYEIWQVAVSTIDDIVSGWTEHYSAFLNISGRELENAWVSAPKNIIQKSDVNSIRFKTVQLVQQSYANRRTGILRFFDSKTNEIP